MAADMRLLKELRKKTGVSFSVIKKALEESNNDPAKAEKLMSEWGVKKAADKADRDAGQGGVFTYMHHNRKIATMVELRTETDFVAGNDEFRKLGMELAMQMSLFRGDSVEEFLKQQYIRDMSKTVDQLLKDAILKFGENIRIARIIRWELGE
ncbi:MAG: elongation factor Ts [Patescibacteria group bacterium]|nr:elongation factor Ts [Patescibacteria group bacterium]